MTDKEIFDLLIRYSRDYVVVNGFTNIYEENGFFLMCEEFTSNDVIVLGGGYWIEEMLTAFDEFFEECVDVDKEGFYHFTALIKNNNPEWGESYEVAHIEWDYVCTVEEQNELIKLRAELIQEEDDLPF